MSDETFKQTISLRLLPWFREGQQIEPNKMKITEIHSANVSTRFLILLAHFFILICLLWNKEETLRLCSSVYEIEDALYFQKEHITVLLLSIGSILVEYFGLLSGISMFCQLHGLISIICHTTAALTWSISYINKWDCSTPFNWYIFISCSSPPLLSEITILFHFCNRIIRA